MSKDPLLHFGPYRLDVGNEQLWRDSQLVRLTPKALQVLHTLVNNPGQLMTKEELFRGVWPETVVSDAALTSCIQELRQALGDNARTPQYIETAHRRGFRFIAAVTAAQVSTSKFRASTSEEENQKPVLSVVEGENGNSSLESRVQSPESNGQELESGIQEQHSEPTPDPQPSIPNSQPPASTRFWSRAGLMLTGLVLIVGTILAVQYLSLPLPNTQPLTPSTQPGLPLPDKPSIIVLPFVNLSGDPAQEYFSDGMTEEITATLSRISSLFVIARTSAFTYKGKAVKVQDISREMGVRYVLEGSVQKTNGQVRIIAQLIDATTGEHLWAEHYDRPLKDIFSLQDEIRQQIALVLQVQIALEESVRSQSAPTTNLDAYDFYLRGMEAFWRAIYKNDPLTSARQMYESAIALDSQYAEAYARLGETYLFDWFFDPSRNQGQSLERAFAMEQRAIALNDALPLPHAILGTVSAWKKQYAQALVEAQRAVTLDPNFAEGYFHLGTVLFFAGPPDESVKAYEQAIRLNPKHPDIYLFNLAASYRIAGRYKEALDLGKEFAAHHPDYSPVHFHLAVCYAELGQLEEARAERAEILRLIPTFTLAGFERFWPMKDPAVMERTVAALRKAGLK